MPYAVNLWQPCLPTLLRKPAATAGAIFQWRQALVYLREVGWVEVRKAATTGSVTGYLAGADLAPAVKIKTATTQVLWPRREQLL